MICKVTKEEVSKEYCSSHGSSVKKQLEARGMKVGCKEYESCWSKE